MISLTLALCSKEGFLNYYIDFLYTAYFVVFILLRCSSCLASCEKAATFTNKEYLHQSLPLDFQYVNPWILARKRSFLSTRVAGSVALSEKHSRCRHFQMSCNFWKNCYQGTFHQNLINLAKAIVLAHRQTLTKS